jgi:hypothetical protein
VLETREKLAAAPREIRQAARAGGLSPDAEKKSPPFADVARGTAAAMIPADCSIQGFADLAPGRTRWQLSLNITADAVGGAISLEAAVMAANEVVP